MNRVARRLQRVFAPLTDPAGRMQRLRLVSISHLLSGNIGSALLALGATALTARALGPLDYGLLALTLAYTRAVERLVTFQSWQPLIKYGAALTGPEHRDDLRALLKFGLLLDIGGALLAWAAAVAVALIAAPRLGWSPATLHTLLIYSLVLPFNLNGMATAVLRIFGRFRTAAYGPMVGAGARLLLCAAALAAGKGLLVFAAIWMLTQIIGALAVLAFAFRVLRENGINGILRAPLAGVTQRFDKLWSFAWSSNLSLTIRSSAQQFDVLIVGALAGPAEAGLYHIAKRAGRLAEQVGTQVQAVVYPDIARLWAGGAVKAIADLVWQVEWLLLSVGVTLIAFFYVAATPLLRWTAGPEFVAAAPLLTVQMVAVTLAMAGSGARAGLLAMGRQNQVMAAVLAGTAAFHVTALLMIPVVGAMGANIAHIVLGLIASVAMIHDFRSAVRVASPKAARVP